VKQYSVCCDACAGQVHEPEAVYAVLYDQDVRVCGPECLHRLRSAWAPKRVPFGAHLMAAVALALSAASLCASLVYLLAR